MECTVCGVRSAVDSCLACSTLLCEECGAVCEQCQKRVCPDHAKQSRSGKVYCETCFEEREERRRKRREGSGAAEAAGGATSFEALEKTGEDEDFTVLTASAQRGIEPWKMSLYVALLGLALIGLTFVIPALRGFSTSGGTYVPIPYFFVIVPGVAFVWGCVGLFNRDYIHEKVRNVPGILVALLTVGLAYLSVQTDPARQAAIETQQNLDQRQQMTPEELQQWRRDQLRQFGAQ